MSEAGGLTGYDSVILGAPIHGMRWVPEAAAFVEAHGADLRALPVALFAVSYMYGAARSNWNRAMEKSVRSAAESAGARTSTIFPGRVGSPLPGFARVLFGVPRDLPADRTDPEAVRAWARGLPKSLTD
jgi:menaquinone-dependent protoporphyrinogen oxidase